MNNKPIRRGNTILSVEKCGSCGSAVRYIESVYMWFRKFIIAECCTMNSCGFSKFICLICGGFVDLHDEPVYVVAYFKHILSHYGLTVNYNLWPTITDYTVDELYFDSTDVYNSVRQLLFVAVEKPIKQRCLKFDDIQYNVKDFTSSCLICKQSGVDTFYETFPTLEVIVLHLMKVHVNKSAVTGELPKLIDFIRNVDFE